MILKLKSIRKDNRIPEYKTALSSGMDLYPYIDNPVILNPMEIKLFPTGYFIEIPEGYEAQIRPRSGMAIKHGITVVNAPGTIDADYRGEIKIGLINLGSEPFTISNDMRIAQMVIAPVVQAQLEIVEELSETERGSGGFGHTGKY